MSEAATMTKDHHPKMIWRIETEETTPQTDYTMFFSSGKRLLHKMAFGLIPSFIQRRLRPASSKSQRLHPTSYLDGLRGVASFIVFMGHYTEENLGWYTEPYGLYEDGVPSSPLQLPFVRVIFSARPMVHIFFVISGYVLSYKALKQIHTQSYASLHTTLSSSVFRRALRLYLPSIITLMVMAISVQLNISDGRYAERLVSLPTQLRHAGYTCWALLEACFHFQDIDYPQPIYNPALWTIPVEFSQSLILFTVILGLSRCTSQIRTFLVVLIMYFCFTSGQLYSVEFLGGMMIAEFTLLQDRSLITPSTSPTILPTCKFSAPDQFAPSKNRCLSTTTSNLKSAFWYSCIIIGLFIASWTNSHVTEVWGLSYLYNHTPEPYEGQRVWFCLGAFLIVSAFTQLPSLQKLFSTPIPQYLGQISYALYLVHNLCLTTLEPRIMPIQDRVFGKATFWGRHACWVTGLMVYVPVIIFVADVWWRVVDCWSVRFARWLEGVCVVEKKS